jgi:MSHA biogenesis protein MshK
VICLCFAIAGVAPARSLAQPLADPMQPFDARAYAAPSAGAASASALQGVLTSPGRKFALISGVTVPLGGAWRDAKLIELTESSAVLQRDGEREVLRMYPHIERKPIGRAPASQEQAER